jgi:heme exporter protein A
VSVAGAGISVEPAAVRARGLRKAFGAQVALDGIDLDLPAGTFLTLLGPNGAGKTTLLRLFAGLSRPSGGELRVLGAVPGPGAADLRARVGLVSHAPQLYADLSAEENLRFFAALYGIPDPDARIDAALARVELRSRRADAVRTFSRGMTQRLSIARALIHEPGLLLFDEPTTGLDDRAVGILVQLLAELHDGKRTLILTTHRLDVGLRVADRVAVQARGRIVHEAEAKRIDPASFAGLYASLTEGRA